MAKLTAHALAAAAFLAVTWTAAASAQECKPEDRKILTVWDQFEYYGMTAAGPAVEEIHQAFQDEHPCVVFSRSVFGGGFPIRNAVELALTSGEAPDVFYSWPSGAGLTTYANAGYCPDGVMVRNRSAIAVWLTLMTPCCGRFRSMMMMSTAT